MILRTPVFWMAFAALCSAASLVHAEGSGSYFYLSGNPTNLAQSPLLTKDFGSAPIGGSVNGSVETVTVHLVQPIGDMVQADGPQPGAAAIINIAATGDFAVVGGTCVGATGLVDGSTCTLDLRFSPTAGGIRSGLLSMTCSSPVVAVGVLGLPCDNQNHSAYNLTGTGVPASAIPALDRAGIMLLALVLLGASMLALRRRR